MLWEGKKQLTRKDCAGVWNGHYGLTAAKIMFEILEVIRSS